MKIPKITGTIERRILINYQVDKDVVVKFLPEPFRPKLVNERAVVGICLIRLKDIRPIMASVFTPRTYFSEGCHPVAATPYAK